MTYDGLHVKLFYSQPDTLFHMFPLKESSELPLLTTLGVIDKTSKRSSGIISMQLPVQIMPVNTPTTKPVISTIDAKDVVNSNFKITDIEQLKTCFQLYWWQLQFE